MSLIKTIEEWNEWFIRVGRNDHSLGFVPTMGFLHEGHLSLIRKAKEENDLVAVSIFVNPTQFAPGEDFENYPRDIERDYKLAMAAGADVVFHPDAKEMYGSNSNTVVEVGGEITQKLCGVSRPTHFKGVTTVVTILFNIIGPDRAYFGQKDAQQGIIIQKMVRDLHQPVKVVMCPIVREEDGLAMSSRNVYLNTEERKQAICLSEALQLAEEYIASGAEDANRTETLKQIISQHIGRQSLATIDYVQILDGETLEEFACLEPGKTALAALAVRFGNTRLIDNKLLSIS